MDRQLADQVAVQQRGQLAERRIGSGRRPIVHLQRVGKDGDFHRS